MGNQTSILMSESLEGVSVAATRQNAGSPVKAEPAPPPRAPLGGAGGENPPGATSVAMVTFAFASFRVVTLSHDAAAACAAGQCKFMYSVVLF
jgi:hypothetical protein